VRRREKADFRGATVSQDFLVAVTECRDAGQPASPNKL